MASQSVDRRRCLSCNRWGGARAPGAEPGTVEYDEDNDRGPCQEGPWHGSSRRGPRNACGQWLMWVALAPVADASGAAAPGAVSSGPAPPQSPNP
ncbi:MAG: hypothetical protein LCH90_04840 [Proteobacteria bacterium]|nr:hypothetical protein [Pseudomonadota bacterium]